MALDISLRNFLIANLSSVVLPNASSPGVIQMSKIQENAQDPHIWFQRSGRDQELALAGQPLILTETFDLECISKDPDTCQTLASAVRDLLHGYRGAFDSDTALLVEVDDQSDDYLFFNLDQDEGIYPSALSIKIMA